MSSTLKVHEAGDQKEILSIVIPALNEEESIADIVSRCLEAKIDIQKEAGIDEVEIIVVSDGSTDRTVERAKSFSEIQVVVFEENQGYGAAIKEGWRQSAGSLLAFIDADGTCDPRYFADMCRILRETSADIVLGSRLGPDSRMPFVRRLGNRIYALLLGYLCGRYITDAASGMRVVRRESLTDLYPLPDGLHFTPSMSARALLNGLKIVELPMPYEERVGASKLSVLKDGIRFFGAIIRGVLCYRPERIFLLGFAFCSVLILILAATPAEFYFSTGKLEEWMIYRFTLCYLLGSFALLLLLATALSNRMATFGPSRDRMIGFWPSLIARIVQGRSLTIIMGTLILISVIFLWPGIIQYLSTGEVNLHWSRLLAGILTTFAFLQTGVFAILIRITNIWRKEQQSKVDT